MRIDTLQSREEGRKKKGKKKKERMKKGEKRKSFRMHSTRFDCDGVSRRKITVVPPDSKKVGYK